MHNKINLESLSPEEIASAYIKYVCDELTDDTMTQGEFIKQLETSEEFYRRFFPDYRGNTFDWTYNNDIEIK